MVQKSTGTIFEGTKNMIGVVTRPSDPNKSKFTEFNQVGFDTMNQGTSDMANTLGVGDNALVKKVGNLSNDMAPKLLGVKKTEASEDKKEVKTEAKKKVTAKDKKKKLVKAKKEEKTQPQLEKRKEIAEK